MSKSDNLVIHNLIHSIGLKNNLVDSRVKEIVEAQFKFAYEVIRKTDLTSTQEEVLSNIKTNIYFKYIGKLHIEPDKVALRNNKLNKHNDEEREEDS